MKKLNTIIAATLILFSTNSFTQECPALSGDYIIGQSNESDYGTITEAFNALECGGVEGPVIFYVENGIYNERVALSKVEGASAFNTITFTSRMGVNSDVVISYGSSDATLVMVGTSYITFENMTIDHKAATYGNCVRVDGGANHLQFKGMVFNGVEMPRTGNTNAVVYFTSIASNHNIAFEGCEINNGSAGIWKDGVSAGAPDHQTSITETLFFNQQEAGIVLTNENAPVVSGNTINTLSTYKNFTALRLDNVQNQLLVAKNIVNVSGSGVGLLMNNCVASADVMGQVNNNSFTIGGSREAYGMLLTGNTDHQELQVNRVKLNVNPTDGSTQAFCKNTSAGRNINIENSIFHDMSKGAYTVFGNSYKSNSSSKVTPALSASTDGVSAAKTSSIK